MNIVILFSPNFPELVDEFFVGERETPEIIGTDYDISPLLYDQKAVVTDYNDWDFVFLNIAHCFNANFQKKLKRLSEQKSIYMSAINDSAEALWFEHHADDKL